MIRVTSIDHQEVEGHPSEILARLEHDRLSGLAPVLKCTRSYVAGSYLLPGMMQSPDHVADLDIWVPFAGNAATPDQPAGSEPGGDSSQEAASFRRLGTLVGYLIGCGYKMHTAYTARSDREDAGVEPDHAYKRIRTMLQSILTFRPTRLASASSRTMGGEPCKDALPTRVVQVLVMNRRGGSTPVDIVRHFDLTHVMRYFDGARVWATERSLADVRSRTLRINCASSVITQQSFPEWCRTLQRVQKYADRGYVPSDDMADQLVSMLRATFRRHRPRVHTTYSCNRDFLGTSVALVQDSYIRQWEYRSRAVFGCDRTYPKIALSMPRGAMYIRDLYVQVESLPPDVQVTCTDDVGDKASSLVRLDVPAELAHVRTVRWCKRMHVIASMLPFPNIAQVTASRMSKARQPGETMSGDPVGAGSHGETAGASNRFSVADHLFDPITLEEHTVQSFLAEQPTENLVLYTAGAAHAISVSQIRHSILCVPCKRPDSKDTLGVNELHAAVVQLCLCGGTYYAPYAQVLEWVRRPGNRCAQVVPTGIEWDRSVVYERDGPREHEHVGGYSRSGHVQTRCTISFLARVRLERYIK